MAWKNKEFKMESDKIKIETKIGDRPFTIEGTKTVVLETLRDLEKEYGNRTSVNSTTPPATEHMPKPHRPQKAKPTLEVPVVDQLVGYLLKKDRYEHDTLEIEDVFWGKRITARENETLYRKLHGNLKKARHRIETMKQGKFEAHLSSSKNLKKYVFRPITQTLGILNGKTSPTS